MTKRYAILQKKLQELESEIAVSAADFPRRRILPDGVDQQLVFLKNLLSAEMASHPSKPHHLRHIGRRLDQLETAFRDCRDTINNHDDVATSVSDVVNHFETASTCSCTESCLNDDGEGEGGSADVGSPVDEGPETFYEAVVGETAPAEEAVRVETDRSVSGGFWRFCGAMGGGAVVGAVVMGFAMVRFSCCFHCLEFEGPLVPT